MGAGEPPRGAAAGHDGGAGQGARCPAIEVAPSRHAFAELLREALAAVELRPSPTAVAYLLNLLEGHLRAPEPAALGPPLALGEALLQARRDQGAPRLRQLRALGDRALFLAGVFGDSLRRRPVDIDYYGEVGSTAYCELAEHLAGPGEREATWRGLFLELSQGFLSFVDLLAEVGDRTRPGRETDVARLLERFDATGSARDRRRLLARGVCLDGAGPRGRLQ